jgi:hypothetical protein
MKIASNWCGNNQQVTGTSNGTSAQRAMNQLLIALSWSPGMPVLPDMLLSNGCVSAPRR